MLRLIIHNHTRARALSLVLYLSFSLSLALSRSLSFSLSFLLSLSRSLSRSRSLSLSLFQLMARAAGCKTYKLKFGNRGHNQPVKDMLTDKVHKATLNRQAKKNPRTTLSTFIINPCLY